MHLDVARQAGLAQSFTVDNGQVDNFLTQNRYKTGKLCILAASVILITKIKRENVKFSKAIKIHKVALISASLILSS